MNRSPRLLSVNNFHYRRAGSDVAFLEHDRLFRARGWETAVFSMHHSENLDSEWGEHFVKEIEFTRAYSLGAKLRLASKVLYSWEARSKLDGLLTRFRPHVAHVHSVYHHLSPAILPVLKRHHVPVVLTAHDYKLACPAYKMFDERAVCEDCRGGSVLPLIRKRCVHGSVAISSLVAFEAVLHRYLGSYANTVARIACPSGFLLEKLVEWGWSRERVAHVPNFVDLDAWNPDFTPGRYFLYFGRLAPEKGLHTLVRAAAIAKCPIKIVGWGQLRGELEALAQRLDAPVEFAGRAPPESLAALIRNARAVVVPSEWYENASLAALEAFACGKPVIASRIGGNPELVLPGLNGWLFDPGNHVELAERMRQVSLLPAATVETLGRAARDRVRTEHSPGRYFNAMMALYRTLGVEIRNPIEDPANVAA